MPYYVSSLLAAACVPSSTPYCVVTPAAAKATSKIQRTYRMRKSPVAIQRLILFNIGSHCIQPILCCSLGYAFTGLSNISMPVPYGPWLERTNKFLAEEYITSWASGLWPLSPDKSSGPGRFFYRPKCYGLHTVLSSKTNPARYFNCEENYNSIDLVMATDGCSNFGALFFDKRRPFAAS